MERQVQDKDAEDSRPRDDSPVVAATAATVEEAETFCALLRAEGIPAFAPGAHSATLLPHLQVALCPRGVPVMVPREGLPAAKELLSPPPPDGEHPRPPAETPQERYEHFARSAGRAAMYTLPAPLMAFFSVYYHRRACRLRRKHDDEIEPSPRTESQMRCAVWRGYPFASLMAVGLLLTGGLLAPLSLASLMTIIEQMGT